MGSTKIAAVLLTMALLTGCTLRTQAPSTVTAYDAADRDGYGQSFAASPTYGDQDTSWTTTAPARVAAGSRDDKAPAASTKAKSAEEGASGKFDAAATETKSAPAQAPVAPRPVPRQVTTPAQGAQSPAQVGSGASGR